MTAIKTFALSLCVTAIATSLFYFLLPEQKRGLEHILRFAVSLFFLASLVSAFAGVGELSDLPDYTVTTEAYSSGLQAEIDAQILSLTEEAVEQQLLSSLSEAGITAEKLEVEAYITESGSIEMSRVTVSLSSDAGLDIIRTAVGSDVEIVQEGNR